MAEQKFKRGAVVRHTTPVVEGIVVKRAMHDDQNESLVEYKDKGGETQQVWFLESELEVVK